jgi:3-phenylpropionate/trans-cinnamate dioxygenase ferredoxin reductase component
MADVDVLIVGAGGAGSACAEALAEAGFGGSVIVVGRDVDPPYERPFCSKDYLRGKMSREETYLGVPDGLDLRIRTSVMKLDPAAKTAKLSSGDELSFEHAALGTGANVRRLRVDGCDLDGIHYLRTLGNSDSIREDTAGAEHVVLIGGSYIACEVAASLTAEGRKCTLVMQESLPLSLGFGPTAAEFFAGVLRDHGIDWVANDELARFEGSDGRVRKVVTAGGRELAADAVVLGIGVTPDVMLAKSAGLDLAESGGITCSRTLETSAPGVYAAGDACDYESVVHGRRLRVEHWEHARAQGAHVGRVIAGSPEPTSGPTSRTGRRSSPSARRHTGTTR